MLECKNISKRFKNNKVLKNISIRFPDCGLVSIVGESGCGKSSLLNILGGISGEYSGCVEYNGKDIRKIGSSYQKSVAFVFQDIHLIMWLNIRNNISLPRYFHNGKFYLNALKDDIRTFKISHLSLGQRQKIAHLRMLYKDSQVILCDEPTGSLDYESAMNMMEELKRLSKSRLVILVSHDHKLVDAYSDEIYYMKDGKIEKHIIKEKLIKTDLQDTHMTYKYPFSSLRLSFYNLFTHRNYALSIIAGMYITMLCIMLTLTFSSNLSEQIYEYIYSIVPPSAISFKMKDDSTIQYNIVEKIKNKAGITRCHLYLENYELLGGGFSEAKYEEAKTLFIGDDSLPYENLKLTDGRLPMNDEDIVLSLNYAKMLNDDVSQLLNKSFYIWYKRDLKVIKIKRQIVGIAEDETLVNTIYQKENAYIPLLKHYNNKDYDAKLGIIYIDLMENRNDIYNELKSEFKECEFLKVGESTYEKIDKTINKIELVLSAFTVLSILSSIILVGEVMFLCIIKNKKDFMIMKCFGAKTHIVFSVIVNESVIMYIVASALSLLTYFSIIGLFNQIIGKVLLNSFISFRYDVRAICMSMTIIVLICMISLIPSLIYIMNHIDASVLKE